MTAIVFSKYTGIANVVFNHVICSVRDKITNFCAGENLFCSDIHTTLII